MLPGSRPSEPLRPHAPVHPGASRPALATAMPGEPKPLLAAETDQRTTDPCRARAARKSGMGSTAAVKSSKQVNTRDDLDTGRISCQNGRNAHRACHTSHWRINRSLQRASKQAQAYQEPSKAQAATAEYRRHESNFRGGLFGPPICPLQLRLASSCFKGWNPMALASPNS